MSKIINIPLEGGFDTQSEPSAVGVGLNKMDNLHNMDRGALKQRDGYGTPVEIGGGSNDKLILDIEYWIKDTTLWWLAYDRILGQINRLSSDFGTATSLNNIHQITATQKVGSGNALVVETQDWTGTEATTYYFKITTAGTPDEYSISVDDDTYTNEEDVVTSSTTVTGASSLKAYWGSTTSSALNDKWEVTVYPLPKRIGISNWGNAIRFAYGLYHDPSIYSHIKRKFFHNGTDFFHSYDDYHYDSKSYPREPDTWTYSPTDAQGISGTVSSGGQLTQPMDYYYKIVPLFDGSQLSVFEAVHFGALTTTSTNKSCVINLTLDKADFNTRITGCKIYRADTTSALPKDGEYRLIKTIDFTSAQISWLNTTSAYKGRKLFAHSLTYDYSSWGATEYWGTAQYLTTSPPTATFTKVGTKFLWASTDVDGDKWNQTLASPKYVWASNSQLLLNPTFNGTDGWYNEDGTTPHSQLVSSGNFDDTIRFIPNQTGVATWYPSISTYTDGYQSIALPTGTTKLNFSCQVSCNRTGYFIEYGWRLESSTGAVIWNSPGAYRVNADYVDEVFTTNHQISIPSLSSYAGTTVKLHFMYYFYDNGIDYTPTETYFFGLEHFYAYALKETITTGYTHQSMFAVENSGIADGTAVGKIAKVGGVDYPVVQNQGDIFKVGGSAGWITTNSTSGNAINGAEVSWLRTSEDGTLSATQTKMVFTDVGETESSYHPISSTSSLKTKFKYATSTGGRQYVGNVIIEDVNGAVEEYDDMVMFSELNQPDVIPISNFIKLNDQQGGAITGIRGLFSDIVVFAERGIFRINVPTEDPTSWSMVEAEKNLGCNQPQSICEYRGGNILCWIG